MPFIIGLEAEKVVYFFESKGFKISKITRVPYSYLESGIVVKQFPSPGFRINPKNLISIQISE
jgi:beta-lactam-binding protein with PASTA domain